MSKVNTRKNEDKHMRITTYRREQETKTASAPKVKNFLKKFSRRRDSTPTATGQNGSFPISTAEDSRSPSTSHEFHAKVYSKSSSGHSRSSRRSRNDSRSSHSSSGSKSRRSYDESRTSETRSSAHHSRVQYQESFEQREAPPSGAQPNSTWDGEMIAPPPRNHTQSTRLRRVNPSDRNLPRSTNTSLHQSRHSLSDNGTPSSHTRTSEQNSSNDILTDLDFLSPILEDHELIGPQQEMHSSDSQHIEVVYEMKEPPVVSTRRVKKNHSRRLKTRTLSVEDVMRKETTAQKEKQFHEQRVNAVDAMIGPSSSVSRQPKHDQAKDPKPKPKPLTKEELMGVKVEKISNRQEAPFESGHSASSIGTGAHDKEEQRAPQPEARSKPKHLRSTNDARRSNDLERNEAVRLEGHSNSKSVHWPNRISGEEKSSVHLKQQSQSENLQQTKYSHQALVMLSNLPPPPPPSTAPPKKRRTVQKRRVEAIPELEERDSDDRPARDDEHSSREHPEKKVEHHMVHIAEDREGTAYGEDKRSGALQTGDRKLRHLHKHREHQVCDLDQETPLKLSKQNIEKVVQMLETGAVPSDFSRTPSTVSSSRPSSAVGFDGKSELQFIDKMMEMCTEREHPADNQMVMVESKEKDSEYILGSKQRGVAHHQSRQAPDPPAAAAPDPPASMSSFRRDASEENADAQATRHFSKAAEEAEDPNLVSPNSFSDHYNRVPSPSMAALRATASRESAPSPDSYDPYGTWSSAWDATNEDSSSDWNPDPVFADPEIAAIYKRAYIKRIPSTQLDVIGASDEERLDRDPSPYYYNDNIAPDDNSEVYYPFPMRRSEQDIMRGMDWNAEESIVFHRESKREGSLTSLDENKVVEEDWTPEEGTVVSQETGKGTKKGLFSHEPSLFPFEPSVFSHETSVFSHETSAISYETSAISYETSMTSQGPSLFSNGTSVISHEPSVFSQEPSLFSQEQSSISQEPSLISQEPNTKGVTENAEESISRSYENKDVEESRFRHDANKDVEDSRSRHQAILRMMSDEEGRRRVTFVESEDESEEDSEDDTYIEQSSSSDDSPYDDDDDDDDDDEDDDDDDEDSDTGYDSESASYTKASTITADESAVVVPPDFKSGFTTPEKPSYALGPASSSASDSWNNSMQNLHPIARMRLRNQSVRVEECCYQYY